MEANQRAKRFSASLLLMLVGLIILAALALNILSHSGGT
jgi:hypothetical protein